MLIMSTEWTPECLPVFWTKVVYYQVFIFKGSQGSQGRQYWGICEYIKEGILGYANIREVLY